MKVQIRHVPVYWNDVGEYTVFKENIEIERNPDFILPVILDPALNYESLDDIPANSRVFLVNNGLTGERICFILTKDKSVMKQLFEEYCITESVDNLEDPSNIMWDKHVYYKTYNLIEKYLDFSNQT